MRDDSPTGARRQIPAARLHVLWASHADVAVIFRRGPSRRVEVIRWDTAHDVVERGHWFHGRIYERRSDLSPDGEFLLYFASKFSRATLDDTEYTYAWTAVSRPPWLTALALWPKGDCWHGGGLFTGRRRIILNHRPDRAKPHPGHLPTGLEVTADPNASGEDDPLFARRLARDGWQSVQEWRTEYRGIYEHYRTLQPEVRRKNAGRSGVGPAVVLTRRLDRLRYSETFHVEGMSAPGVIPTSRTDWLDWDQRGRLVLLQDGRVFAAKVQEGLVGSFAEVVDLSRDLPVEREPPAAATRW